VTLVERSKLFDNLEVIRKEGGNYYLIVPTDFILEASLKK
jgi:hypothetical protein